MRVCATLSRRARDARFAPVLCYSIAYPIASLCLSHSLFDSLSDKRFRIGFYAMR